MNTINETTGNTATLVTTEDFPAPEFTKFLILFSHYATLPKFTKLLILPLRYTTLVALRNIILLCAYVMIVIIGIAKNVIKKSITTRIYFIYELPGK